MILKYIFYIIILLSLSYTKEFNLKEELMTKLYPNDYYFDKNRSGNVIQGITSYKDYWITLQTAKDEYLIFNIINNQGKSIFHHRINYPSHGQDLSYTIDINNNLLNLYTTSKGRKGIVEIKFDFNNKKFISNSFKTIDLNLKYSTPTISEDKKFFVIRDGKYLKIYSSELLFLGKNEVLFSFELDKKQQNKDLWFQGIAMKDGLIYCLSSNNKIHDNKFLFIYDLYGNVIKNFGINPGKEFAYIEGNKYELEGLTFKENNLYTIVMTGKTGHNIKRLYKILEVNE